ncbi:LysR family transcriptional regulator [Achromobacter sp. NFACC18-2]|uniref:LysR family transcriptional regulator n=1 Tax=Achromobacter sp. NFACC18-2 TaxID=1564112 RepID=UPI0008D1B2AD|nr:LysR family transcriptional regulator [Achromobacter sp. NFACC18-2]SEK00513.1 transcriptional regulator, LysR family [Achromobacter sp. NFACC18-2]
MSIDSLEWESQRVFLAVLRSGSLSGAARLLNIAQATARRRIEKLEASVGVSLFLRTPAGLQPTDAARELSDHVEAMDVAARAFSRRAGTGADAAEGVVRVTSSELLGVEVLPTMLLGVRQAMPGVRLELSVQDRLEALPRQEADIAVRLQRPSEANVVARRTGALRVGLYAAPGCIRAYGLPQSRAQLRGLPMIGPDRRLSDRRMLAEHGVIDPDQAFAVACDHHVAQFAALKAGLGFGVCPGQLARPLGLVPVLEQEIGFDVDVWIAMHGDLRRVKRVAGVFDALARELDAYLAG